MTFDQIVSVVTDPRKNKNQKYTLLELMLVVISSVISGYYAPDEMADFAKEKRGWLQKFAPFEYGTPSHETIRYFLCAINPTHLVQCFIQFASIVSELLIPFYLQLFDRTLACSENYIF